jgi:hypothetical protein
MLSIEERNALQEPYAIPREASGTPAVFPSVSHLDPERTAALASTVADWLLPVVADLSRLLSTPCTSGPLRSRPIALGAFPSADAVAFWAVVDRSPEHGLVLWVPRAFAAGICERIFGAPLRLSEERALTPGEETLLREVIGNWLGFFVEVWPEHPISPVEAPGTGDPADDRQRTGSLRAR